MKRAAFAVAIMALLGGCIERSKEEVIDRQLIPMVVERAKSPPNAILILREVKSGIVHEMRTKFCSNFGRYKDHEGQVINMLVRTIETTKAAPNLETTITRRVVYECN